MHVCTEMYRFNATAKAYNNNRSYTDFLKDQYKSNYPIVLGSLTRRHQIYP